MGYKWDKLRKLVSLITVAGQRRPQSLIAMKCHAKTKLGKSMCLLYKARRWMKM